MGFWEKLGDGWVGGQKCQNVWFLQGFAFGPLWGLGGFRLWGVKTGLKKKSHPRFGVRCMFLEGKTIAIKFFTTTIRLWTDLLSGHQTSWCCLNMDHVRKILFEHLGRTDIFSILGENYRLKRSMNSHEVRIFFCFLGGGEFMFAVDLGKDSNLEPERRLQIGVKP